MAKTKKAKRECVDSIKKVLTIKDRFAIISLLPKENDIITMVMVRDIEIRMSLTQTEKKKHNFRQTESGGWKWDFPKKSKSFTFSNAEIELLKARIDVLDRQKKITADLLDTCILIRK